MNKKFAVVAGLGALGCMGAAFVMLLIVGGLGALYVMQPDPAPQAYRAGQQPAQRPATQGGQPPATQGGQTPAAQGDDDAAAEGDDATEEGSAAAVSESVTLTGRIVDAATQQGIEGAYFVLLMPGKTYADFQASGDPAGDGIIAGGVKTASDGGFQVQGVPRGNTFTVVAAAAGYQSAHRDNGLEINAQDPAETPLNPIQLTRVDS
jgi:hypothetical protein